MAKDKKPDVVKLPSANVLKSLISQGKTNASSLAELKGDFGKVMSDASAKHNVHVGAFKQVRKLEKMDAVKLMAWLSHFDDYRAKLELDKAAGMSLDLDGEQDETHEEETGDEMIDRVAREKEAEQAEREANGGGTTVN